MILIPDTNSRYIVYRFYWKQQNPSIISDVIGDKNEIGKLRPELFWMKNELYYLKMDDKRILLSDNAWMNDSIMDASQKLICQTLGREKEYQSVLNWQKKDSVKFQTVSEDHIQILHDGNNHWFLSFSSIGCVQICDSLRTTLSRVAMKCINQLYRNCRNKWGKIDVSFLPVRQQTDGWNCGVYAVAFAAGLLDGKSPADASFDVRRMRPHLFRCLEEKKLIPFPKDSSV